MEGSISNLPSTRDETRGAAAVEKLRGLGLSNVIFHQLEITDAPSIARLAGFLKTRFGKLDILVCVAGDDIVDGSSGVSFLSSAKQCRSCWP
uniref:Uncharacterized protein n=1 Tax=Setaria italica TaxID=4555 RepID=K4AI33_SETIT